MNFFCSMPCRKPSDAALELDLVTCHSCLAHDFLCDAEKTYTFMDFIQLKYFTIIAVWILDTNFNFNWFQNITKLL